MNTKIYQGSIRLKGDGLKGEFEAVFATLEKIDKDGDVTRRGAFQENQSVVIEAYGHNYAALPVGKGTIHEVGNEAIVKGKLLLDTQAGRDTLAVMREIPYIEYSYTFDILKASPGTFEGQKVQFLEKLDVWGVSMVQRGAGIGTRTVNLKGSHSDTQRLRAQIDELDNKRRGTWLPLGRSPTIGAPDQARALVDDMILDGVIDDLQARVDAPPESSPAPADEPQETGLIALWRETLAAEGHHPNYVQTVIGAEIYGLAERLQQQNPLIYYSPEVARSAAIRELSCPITPDTFVWFPRVGA